MRKTNLVRHYRDICACTLITLVIAAAATCFSGCGEEKQTIGSNRAGGVIYFGIEVPFQGFDLLKTGVLNPPLAPLNNLMMEPLFRKDSAGNLIPVLGLSATPSADGTAWDIKLRQGVLFHDGTRFNADAVVHHWARILDPQHNFRGRWVLAPVLRIEKIDEFTVRFHLAHPWAPFLNVLSNELLRLAFIPSPTAVDAGTQDREPVGTGPFEYAQWGSGDHFIVLRNDHYWQKGKPYLNKVVFRTIPDPQTRYASLMSGEIDIISIDRGHLIRKAEDDPDLTVYPSKINGAEILLLNMTRPPLDDIRVRRALALANSQERHIKMVYGGSIPLVHHPFGEGFACEDDGYLAHDPGKARQLMADYGKPVELECLHSNTSRGRNIGELLQQLYKGIGVHLKSVGLSPGPHMQKVVLKNYHLATWRIPPSGDYGPGFHARFHSRGPLNFTGYNNPETDRLLEMQRVETDPHERAALLCRIVRRINQDVPILYRGGRRYHIVTRKKIRGMTESPGFSVDLASAWLDEAINFNMAAYDIEQKAASGPAFECPDPGDVDAVKASILGAWKGKDTWGANISMNFKADNTVDLHRTGGKGATVIYEICAPSVYFRNIANIVMTPTAGKLEGIWRKDQNRGEITLERDG